MSKMWAAATGGDASSWYASAFAIISIGNLCAVFMSALLNKLGQIKPSMTGNGRLMVGEEVTGRRPQPTTQPVSHSVSYASM